MSQRRAGIVDRWGKPLSEEAKPVTREQLIEAQNQLRAELNALHRFNAMFYEVMEEQHPGVMAEVIRRLEAEIPAEAKEGKVQ